MKSAADFEKEDFNFQFYINSVKEGEIPWTFFVSLMKDLTQSLPKAQKLIKILLEELKNSFTTFQNYKSSEVTSIVADPNPEENEDQKQIQTVTQNSTKTSKQIKTKDPLKLEYNKEKAEGYECEKCGKSFFKESSIYRHMKRVHGDKNYACSKCDYKTVDNYKLKKHISTHDKIKTEKPKGTECNEKPKGTECNLCGKVLFNSSLLRHIEVVHEKIRHICDLCEMSFQKKFLLDEHVKSNHQGLNPFQCQGCEKSFVKQYKLNQHIRIVHDSRYQCETCSRKFSSYSRLNNHKIEKH